MAAYMVVIATVHDREAFMGGYAVRAGELVERFGGRYFLRAPGAEVLEGTVPAGSSVVISEWPDKASALRFWESPEYAEVKRLREGICDAQVLILEAARPPL